MAYYANTGQGGAHPGEAGATMVGESLSIVVVLLFAVAQGCVDNVAINHAVDIRMAVASGSGKALPAITARAEAWVPHCGSMILSR